MNGGLTLVSAERSPGRVGDPITPEQTAGWRAWLATVDSRYGSGPADRRDELVGELEDVLADAYAVDASGVPRFAVLAAAAAEYLLGPGR